MVESPRKNAGGTPALPSTSVTADGEVGGFPGGETAGDFGDLGETGALEETGGDGGAVAAGAVDEDVAVARQRRGFFYQMIEGHRLAAVDVFANAFTGVADVDDYGRIRTRQRFEGV